MGFIEKIFEQTFSRHPYLFLFMILIVGAMMSHSYNVFAQKTSVEKQLDEYEARVDKRFDGLKKEINAVNKTMLDMFGKQAVMNYSSEIHTLTELDRAGKANDRDRKRLRKLNILLEREKRAINLRNSGL